MVDTHDASRATCKHCRRSFCRGKNPKTRGTANLRRHLKMCHPAKFKSIEALEYNTQSMELYIIAHLVWSIRQDWLKELSPFISILDQDAQSKEFIAHKTPAIKNEWRTGTFKNQWGVSHSVFVQHTTR